MGDFQQRLISLFEGMRLTESERALPVVIRRVVEAACALTDARAGALEILDDDDNVIQLITVGLEPEQVAAIGEELHLRGGHGHPRMTFLEVPVRGRDRLLGKFYLTDKRDGAPFSAEDEEFVAAVAAWAGIAIENAQLYEDTRDRERWLDAFRRVTTALLEGADLSDVLQLVANRARVLARADLASIAIPSETSDDLVVAAADGLHAEDVKGQQFPSDRSLSGEAMSLGRAVRVDDASVETRAYQPVVIVGDMGPTMFVPIKTHAGVFGTISVSNVHGGRRFTDEDARLVESFADQAAVALQYSRVQVELNRLALLEDRERIAHDLHDTVIQRLFATGMALQATARLARTPDVARRLAQAVDDLDATIRDIRSTIFSLDEVNRHGRGLRADVLALAGDAAGSLGFDPLVRFEGAVDTEVSERTAEHLLPTLREALSNVARHARAGWVEVCVEVDGDVTLRVTDNGIGLADTAARHGLGLVNMADRARQLGGSLELRGRREGGTVVEWRVPRPPRRGVE